MNPHTCDKQNCTDNMCMHRVKKAKIGKKLSDLAGIFVFKYLDEDYFRNKK